MYVWNKHEWQCDFLNGNDNLNVCLSLCTYSNRNIGYAEKISLLLFEDEYFIKEKSSDSKDLNFD